MDILDTERLERIAKKDISSLSNEDKAFLRARASYLTQPQKEQYAEVIKPKAVKKAKKS